MMNGFNFYCERKLLTVFTASSYSIAKVQKISNLLCCTERNTISRGSLGCFCVENHRSLQKNNAAIAIINGDGRIGLKVSERARETRRALSHSHTLSRPLRCSCLSRASSRRDSMRRTRRTRGTLRRRGTLFFHFTFFVLSLKM